MHKVTTLEELERLTDSVVAGEIITEIHCEGPIAGHVGKAFFTVSKHQNSHESAVLWGLGAFIAGMVTAGLGAAVVGAAAAGSGVLATTRGFGPLTQIPAGAACLELRRWNFGMTYNDGDKVILSLPPNVKRPFYIRSHSAGPGGPITTVVVGGPKQKRKYKL